MRFIRAFVDPKELAECVDHEQVRALSAVADLQEKTLTTLFSDGSYALEPFAAFPTSGDGTAPEFEKLKIIDYGHTIQIGKYEADCLACERVKPGDKKEVYVLTCERCNGGSCTEVHASAHSTMEKAKEHHAKIVNPEDIRIANIQEDPERPNPKYYNTWTDEYSYGEPDLWKFQTGRWGYVCWKIKRFDLDKHGIDIPTEDL